MMKKWVLLVLFSMLVTSSIASAGSPAAFIENSHIIGTAKQIKAFRIPTRDADGKIRYYDLTINLNVLDSGKIDTTPASITCKVAPNISASQYIAGTYTDGGGDYGYVCTVSSSVLNGGRVEGAINCYKKSSSYYIFSAGWCSGPIDGHPWENDLIDAGIDQISGAENYAWGRVGAAYSSPAWGSLYKNTLISARQVGNQLTLHGYDNDGKALGGITFTKK